MHFDINKLKFRLILLEELLNSTDVKEARAKEKKFWDKMFNVKESNTSSRGVITPGEQVGNLQRNMNNAADFQKRNNINNIVKKWK